MPVEDKSKKLKKELLTETVKARFWSRVKVGRKLECWEWSGPGNVQGYGQFHVDTNRLAHSISFIIFNGELTDGNCIDHICMNRLCVNPLHLREVTHRINCIENSNSVAAKNKSKTHCVNGHIFDVQNTMYRNDKFTSRICKTCLQERNKKTKAKKRISE